MIDIETEQGRFRVWSEQRGSHSTTKVLALHGGPGASHAYLRPLEDLEVELHLYDQLGSGLSDRPEEPSLWTVSRFVDELHQVRTALKLDRPVVYGHSWGAILAIEYALAHPEHVGALIVSNMMTSIPAHNAHVAKLASAIDHSIERFMGTYMCGVTPWPSEVVNAFSSINPAVQTCLRGNDPFLVGGALAEWDRTPDLRRIAIPTLIIAGGRDAHDPSQLRAAADQLPSGHFLLCPEGGHCAMWDDRDRYIAGIRDFLAVVT